MQARLIVTGGKTNKREVSLTVPIVVGRSREAGLTVDHRGADGADAARALDAMQTYLADPVLLLA